MASLNRLHRPDLIRKLFPNGTSFARPADRHGEEYGRGHRPQITRPAANKKSSTNPKRNKNIK